MKNKRKKTKPRRNRGKKRRYGSSSDSDSEGPIRKKRKRGRSRKKTSGDSSSSSNEDPKKLTNPSMWNQTLDLVMKQHGDTLTGEGSVELTNLIVEHPNKYDIDIIPEEILKNKDYVKKKVNKTGDYKVARTQHPPPQPYQYPAGYNPYPPNPYHQPPHYHGYTNPSPYQQRQQYNGYGYQQQPNYRSVGYEYDHKQHLNRYKREDIGGVLKNDKKVDRKEKVIEEGDIENMPSANEEDEEI